MSAREIIRIECKADFDGLEEVARKVLSTNIFEWTVEILEERRASARWRLINRYCSDDYGEIYIGKSPRPGVCIISFSGLGFRNGASDEEWARRKLILNQIFDFFMWRINYEIPSKDSLPAIDDGCDLEAEDLETTDYKEPKNLEEYIERIPKNISPHDYELLVMIGEGFTYHKISYKRGTSYESVKKQYARLRESIGKDKLPNLKKSPFIKFQQAKKENQIGDDPYGLSS